MMHRHTHSQTDASVLYIRITYIYYTWASQHLGTSQLSPCGPSPLHPPLPPQKYFFYFNRQNLGRGGLELVSFTFDPEMHIYLALPLPFGQMRSSTSWVLHSLCPSLCPSLPVSGRKLEISVNIDARTLKFCMSHPWTKSLRFRKNQIVCMSLSLLIGLLPY